MSDHTIYRLYKKKRTYLRHLTHQHTQAKKKVYVYLIIILEMTEREKLKHAILTRDYEAMKLFTSTHHGKIAYEKAKKKVLISFMRWTSTQL